MHTDFDTAQTDSFLAQLDRKLNSRTFPLQILNRDALKFLALFLMTLGHWQICIRKVLQCRPLFWFTYSAEFFAPPAFFFFIAEGFRYTKSRKKYALRLLLCAIVTQIPHTLTVEKSTVKTLFLQWSVLMTLFLGLLALIVLHTDWKLPLRILVIAALTGLSLLLKAEWAVGGIVLILFFDLLHEKPLLRLAGFLPLMYAEVCVMCRGIQSGRQLLSLLLSPVAAIVVITFFYNGKKGHFPGFSKYFFYIWYPLHLLLEFVFSQLL